MDHNNFTVSHLSSNSDLEEELALMRLAFPEEGVDLMIKRLIENHPGFGRDSFLTVREDGKMVASLCMIPLEWSLGGVPLRVVEMGMVATHPDYRNRGIQRALNTEYDRVTDALGYDLSVIEGIPYFYRQFGYEYTVPLDSEASIPLEKLPSYHRGKQKIRAFDDSDIPTAAAMLENSSKRYLVHGIRSIGIWKAQQKSGWQADRSFKGYAVEDRGKLVAYFRVEHKGDRLFLLEASFLKPTDAKAVLSFVKQLGEENGVKTLISRLGHKDPITQLILSAGGEANRPYGWQVKIVNHERLFRKLLPLLSDRLQASKYTDLTETIRINLCRNCLALKIDCGKAVGFETYNGRRGDEIMMNPTVFPKLLMGVRSIDELVEEYSDVMVAQRSRDVMDTLFPKGSSHVSALY